VAVAKKTLSRPTWLNSFLSRRGFGTFSSLVVDSSVGLGFLPGVIICRFAYWTTQARKSRGDDTLATIRLDTMHTYWQLRLASCSAC